MVRHRRGPRPIGSAVGGLAGSLAPATLLADVQRVWESAVGRAVAQRAIPTAARAGTVTVTCESAVWAHELTLMSSDVIGRVNTALGAELVVALRCGAAPPASWARRS